MIYIEPTNLCNLRCRFCPTGSNKPVGAKRGMMEWGLFLRVIDEIEKIGAPKVIGWYMMGEPLLHPRLFDMIRHAKQRLGDSVKHRVFTNGVLLNSGRINQLVECELDLIRISVEALSSDGYEEIAGKAIDYEKFLRGIGSLYARRGTCHIEAKLVDVHLTDADKQKFKDDFGSIADELTIEGLFAVRPDVHDCRIETPPLEEFRGKQISHRICCPQPFYQSAIRWDGKVIVCCADWMNDSLLGDLHTDSLTDIWCGKQLRNFHLMQLRGGRFTDKVCTGCGIPECAQDNIDAYRKTLIKRLENTPCQNC